jgi:hypothetical protein
MVVASVEFKVYVELKRIVAVCTAPGVPVEVVGAV